MTREEILNALKDVGEHGLNSPYGTSYNDAFRNAQERLSILSGLYNQNGLTDADKKLLDTYQSAEKANRSNAVLGGALAGLNGLTSIFGTASNLAETNDTGWYDNQINQRYQIGKNNYGSFDQIADEYQRLGYTPLLSYGDVRGKSLGQKLAGVGSSTLSGATTGLQIGGPWGALIGGVIGAGAGAAGWIMGDQEAENQLRFSKNNAYIANDVASVNLGSAHERTTDYKFRSAVPGVKRDGGQIKRQQSIQEFAEHVLKKQRTNNKTHSAGFVRQKAEGGTMIRLKVK